MQDAGVCEAGDGAVLELDKLLRPVVTGPEVSALASRGIDSKLVFARITIPTHNHRPHCHSDLGPRTALPSHDRRW